MAPEKHLDLVERQIEAAGRSIQVWDRVIEHLENAQEDIKICLRHLREVKTLATDKVLSRALSELVRRVEQISKVLGQCCDPQDVADLLSQSQRTARRIEKLQLDIIEKAKRRRLPVCMVPMIDGLARARDELLSKPVTARKRGSWAGNVEPALASPFTSGPIEGTLKELADCLQKAPKWLRTNNGKAIWVQRIDYRTFKIWFNSPGMYAVTLDRMALQKDDAKRTEEDPKGPKGKNFV